MPVRSLPDRRTLRIALRLAGKMRNGLRSQTPSLMKGSKGLWRRCRELETHHFMCICLAPSSPLAVSDGKGVHMELIGNIFA